MLEGGLGQLGNCRTVDLTDLKAKIIEIAVKHHSGRLKSLPIM